jgi:F-type H+-transporting ATPase subunit b
MEALGINLGTFLMYLFNFIIALFVISLAFGPITKMLDERKQKIAKGLEDARIAAEARANAEKEAESIKQSAQTERARLIAEASSQAEKVAADIKAAAEADKAKIVAAARAEAEADKLNVLKDVRGQVASLAIAATNRLLGANLDEARQKALIDDFFAGVRGGKVAVVSDVPAGTAASAEVTSALPLSAAEQSRIAGELKDKLGTAANIVYKVDPAILGGLVVRIGDREIDGSVRRKTVALEQSLK